MLLYDNEMGREQGYTNHNDFQVLEFYCSFYIVKSSSIGWNRWRIHFSNSNIKFTFYFSPRFSAHEHRFLRKFNYLDFISVKYSNQLLMALSGLGNEICKSVCRMEHVERKKYT